MDKHDKYKYTYLSGVATGVLMSIIALLTHSPDIDKVVIFQRENKPRVMRMYRAGRDGIYVENSKNTYIPLPAYIKELDSKSEAGLEGKAIREAVRLFELTNNKELK